MRVVSYNILDGGVGRADPLAEILIAQRAGVIGLVEADDPDVVDRIAKRLDVDFLVGRGREGHAVALLARGEIVESINHAAMRADGPRCFLEATVQMEKGPVTIGLLHLSAHAGDADEDARMAEIAVVLHTFAAHRRDGRPHLLMGDFNSNSPVAEVDPEKLKPRSRREFDANGAALPRRVIRAILDAGYVDTLHARHPADAASAATFTTHHPGQRVDYIFAHGLTPVGAWVERDRLATYASDHHPVGAEFAGADR